jgi:Xaa-Pro dipeptidase
MKELFEDHHRIILNNITQIMANHETESLLIHSGSLVYHFLDDMPKAFKVNPHFNYLAPLTEHPNCFIHIKAESKPTLYYYKPVDYWHEMAADPAGFWIESFDIKIIQSEADLRSDLKGISEKTAIITPNPEQFADGKLGKVNPPDLITELHFIRAEKTAYEQACIREANKKAAKAHRVAEDSFRNGKSEYQINLDYLASLKVNQNDVPYSNIIALNRNAATLHYTVYKHEQFKKDSLHSFLIDAGASYNGYAADITRSYAKENNEFAEMILSFDKKQLRLVNDIELDTSYTQNQYNSHTMVAEILKEFKFINMQPEDIVFNKITNAFYPHGVGHFLGIQVHDVGGFLKDPKGTQIAAPKDHPNLRLTRTVRQNHVFTIEPGLYFIDSLLSELKSSPHASAVNWDKVDQFRKFGGIRIEDNICMHKNTIENITRDAFNETA